MKKLKELLRQIYAKKIMDELVALNREIEIIIKEIDAISEDYIKFKKKVITGKPAEIDREILFQYAYYLTLNPSERKRVLGK